MVRTTTWTRSYAPARTDRECGERVRELYAQGLAIDFIVEQLGGPSQAVAEMIEGDAELWRQHAARVALDRKLIGEEPVADDISVDHLDGLPEDRGGAEIRSATRSATEERPAPQARNASEERTEVQPDGPAGGGGHENDSGGEPAVNGAPAAEAEAAERRRATEEQPAPQLRKAIADRGVQPQDATADRPGVQPSRQQRNPERAEGATAEKIVKQVIDQVRVAYGYYPDQFTSKDNPTPQLEEAWQMAMYIAARVTGLSPVQLSAIFGCDSSTVLHAVTEMEGLLTVVATLRGRILNIDARIREEFGIPWIRSR